MAFFGGIGGGVASRRAAQGYPRRSEPDHLVVCILVGLLIGDLSVGRPGGWFRTGTLAFFKSFTLRGLQLGAHKALEHDLGIFAAVVVGLLATTAGGVFIDLFSGVTPEVVRPAEHLVTTAVISSTVYAVIAVQAQGSLEFFYVTLIAATVGFVFRVVAVKEHWKQMVPLAGAAAGPR
jgi:uncharacterized membrane protein YeiH